MFARLCAYSRASALGRCSTLPASSFTVGVSPVLALLCLCVCVCLWFENSGRKLNLERESIGSPYVCSFVEG